MESIQQKQKLCNPNIAARTGGNVRLLSTSKSIAKRLEFITQDSPFSLSLPTRQYLGSKCVSWNHKLQNQIKIFRISL